MAAVYPNSAATHRSDRACERRGSFLMKCRAALRSIGGVLLFFSAIRNVADAEPRGHGQLLTIPVLVNGEVGMFLVDTGSARSAVDHAFAQRLGLRTMASAGIKRNFSSKMYQS